MPFFSRHSQRIDMLIDYVNDRNPRPFEAFCAKRRAQAEVLVSLTVNQIKSLAKFQEDQQFTLPHSFPQSEITRLIAAEVLEQSGNNLRLTDRGSLLVRWLNSPRKPRETHKKRQELFQGVSERSPDVRGLLLLLNHEDFFPRKISTASSLREKTVAFLERTGAIERSRGYTLTEFGKTVAEWFDPPK